MKKLFLIGLILIVPVMVQAETLTPNYGLIKSEVGADTGLWGGYINDSFDTMDNVMASPSWGINHFQQFQSVGTDTLQEVDRGYFIKMLANLPLTVTHVRISTATGAGTVTVAIYQEETVGADTITKLVETDPTYITGIGSHNIDIDTTFIAPGRYFYAITWEDVSLQVFRMFSTLSSNYAYYKESSRPLPASVLRGDLTTTSKVWVVIILPEE